MSILSGPFDRLEPGEFSDVLGRGFALLIANQPDVAGEIFSDVLRHPLADSRSAAIAEFALVLADGLLPCVRRRRAAGAGAGSRKSSRCVERCGLGWVARMTRASLALTTQADGCEAAQAVHEDCERDADPWGAALALLFEGLGRVLRADDASAAFDEAAAAFNELGADAMGRARRLSCASPTCACPRRASPDRRRR